MKRYLILAMLVAATSTSTAAAVQIVLGETAQLTQHGVKYTGILVKQNTLAPCDANSSDDDIVFDPQKDNIVAWPKPCPKLRRFVTMQAIKTYLKGNMDLWQASSLAEKGQVGVRPSISRAARVVAHVPGGGGRASK